MIRFGGSTIMGNNGTRINTIEDEYYCHNLQFSS